MTIEIGSYRATTLIQYSLDLVQDKAMRADRGARKIRNGALAGIASEPAGAA
jgi:hypothetical protein